MFRLVSLTLDNNGQTFAYDFHPGVNFFRGANNTGKTVFYEFIDYMLGASQDLSDKEWFQDSLSSAILCVETANLVCHFKRTLLPEVNYFRYDDEDWSEELGLYEYKAKLDSLICPDPAFLADLRKFAEEALTFRTYTAFSFMGEKSFGNLTDFLDKGKSQSYAYKLAAILNHFFNQNLEEVGKLQAELENLVSRLEKTDNSLAINQAIIEKVNEALDTLGVGKFFNGANSKSVKDEVERIRSANTPKPDTSAKRDIAKLEVLLSNMDEQIKVFETARRNLTSFEAEATNRRLYISELQRLMNQRPDFSYLVAPVEETLEQLDKSISFNKYLSDNPAIELLKEQRQKVRKEIHKAASQHKIYTQPEKTQAMGVIDTLLRNGFEEIKDDRSDLRRKIKEIRDQIKMLQQLDNRDRVEEVSRLATSYYKLGTSMSPLVRADFERPNFMIRYIKKGNILQPQSKLDGQDLPASLDLGSLARHTLIQLSGYLALLTVFVQHGRYPIVPILVIDHISKPFDTVSRMAIGPLVENFVTTLGEDSIQIFLFDDKSPQEMGFGDLAHAELANSTKSGFNPFFRKLAPPESLTGATE